MKRTLGGDRLGSGKKMKVDLRTYERSTHDLGYIWRSTMACGTLVPFMVELGLPGDTFDIDLNCDIKTHPTIGPLFGSYKIQLDVFQCPIRIYQGQLHNNKLGIGLDMSKVKLPQLVMEAAAIDYDKPIDNQQINPSSIYSYLNIRGLGRQAGLDPTDQVRRSFNGIPYLAYWDIYKNYYANKQEEIGVVIHNDRTAVNENLTQMTMKIGSVRKTVPATVTMPATWNIRTLTATDDVVLVTSGTTPPNPDNVMLYTIRGTGGIEDMQKIPVSTLFNNFAWNPTNKQLQGQGIPGTYSDNIFAWGYIQGTDVIDEQPQLKTFKLENLDTMREDILAWIKNPNAYIINKDSIEPYNLGLKYTESAGGKLYSKMASQEGLAIKTYNSDLFNNWLSTEWIDGENGVNAITAIDTSEGNFTIDTLNLSKKVYDMLNRIAISGGSYDDWLDTVWTHERYQRAESPMYMGGLIKELVFQEVVSNAAGDNESQPLGTLAGKGVMSKKNKGGKITVKVDEPSYLIGIISATPRLDYSQGNKFDTNLKTMDDLHKPALDQIGFQDLITDQMAWFDTEIDGETEEPRFKSAGKQPAWINYMTNVNQVRGNFAIEDNEMFMTLNRKYEVDQIDGGIKDLTTYIDPVKFNNIFAETARDAQNFWTQIGLDITARRKMSAKIIPNL